MSTQKERKGTHEVSRYTKKIEPFIQFTFPWPHWPIWIYEPGAFFIFSDASMALKNNYSYEGDE